MAINQRKAGVILSYGYILAQAQNYLSTPYVFGGYSPEGFDCAGLIYYMLTKAGYTDEALRRCCANVVKSIFDSAIRREYLNS